MTAHSLIIALKTIHMTRHPLLLSVKVHRTRHPLLLSLKVHRTRHPLLLSLKVHRTRHPLSPKTIIIHCREVLIHHPRIIACSTVVRRKITGPIDVISSALRWHLRIILGMSRAEHIILLTTKTSC